MVHPPFSVPVFTYFLKAQNKKGTAGVNLLTRPGLVAIMCEVVVTATQYGGLRRTCVKRCGVINNMKPG